MAHKLLGLGIIVSLLVVSTTVWAESADPKVVSGTASFQQSGANWTITTSDQAVINWQRFDVPAGSTMQFVQPGASSLVVNRVVGPAGSYINGLLTANGRLYLINPHGITVGPTGIVQVNSFIASTLNASNAELLSGGEINFVGISPAAIENFGRIEAIGGDIYLVAARVSNHGTVSAPGGKVGVAAGNDVLLTHDKELFVRPTGLAGVGGTGIDNSGVVEAVSVELKAHGNMYDLAVNTSGVVRATGFGFQDGRVVLKADGGTVVNSGVLAAKTVDDQGKTTGGEVQVLGRRVALLDGSRIDVSGDLGGGQVNVGGSYQGKGPLPNAAKTVVLAGARIAADALESGDGGQVIVWSDDYTLFDGQISARGGVFGGNGGLVETSCRDLLVVSAGQVDCGAPSGQGGNWLLDPYDVDIVDSVPPPDYEEGSWVDGVFTATGNGARIEADLIEGTLNGGTDVTIQTGSGGGKKRTITVIDNLGAAITMDAIGVNATLRLEASGEIIIHQTIGASNGVLNVELQAGSTVTVNAAIDTNGGYVTVDSGDKLTLSQDVTATGARITLNPNKNGVEQAGGSLTAGELLLLGAGTFDLNGDNNVATLAADINGALTYRDTGGLTVGTLGVTDGITTTDDDVTLNTGGTVTLLQSLTVGRGQVTLNTGGGVNQIRALTADDLLLLGTGDFDLSHPQNDVDTLAAEINGTLICRDVDGLRVGTVGVTSGIDTGNGNGNVTLYTTTGGVDQTSELTAGGLLLLGAGDFDLNHGDNDVDTLAAIITGALTYRDTGGLTVGTVPLGAGAISGIDTTGEDVTLNTGSTLTLAQNVTAAGARVTLNPTAGGVTQTNGSLTADELLLVGGGNFSLGQAGNNVGTLAGNIASPLTFTDPDTLTVGQLGSTKGISTGGNDLTLNTGNTLTLADNVTADGARVTLNPTAGGVNQTGGSLTAGELLLLGGGDFSLTRPGNNVDTLAANIASPLTFTDTDALTVGTVGGTSGIATGGDDVTLNTGNTLTLAQNVTATGATVTLNPAAGGLNQTGGVLTADSLLLGGAGNFTLTDMDNDFATIAANVNGPVTLRVPEHLEVGTVGGVDGIRTSGWAVEISAPFGRIVVSQPIDTTPGTGGILEYTGFVIFTSPVLVGAGDVTLRGTPLPLPSLNPADQSGDYDSRRGRWVNDHLDEMTYQELLAFRRKVEELAGADPRWTRLLTTINTYMEAAVSRMENTTFYKP